MGAEGVLGEHGSFLLLFGTKSLPTVIALFLVIVGQPIISIIYGLGLGCWESVEQVLVRLLTGSEVTLGLCGYKGIDKIWGKRGAMPEKAETSCEWTTELWCTSLLHHFRANVW
jgi:hypothetical protein